MKKIVNIFSAMISALMLFSCANGLEGNGSAGAERAAENSAAAYTTKVTINVMYADAKTDWNVWAWKSPSNKNYSEKAWPGDLAMTRSGDFFTYTLSVDTESDLGCLFVGASGSPQTDDIVIPKEKLTDGAEFWFIYGDTTIYDAKEDCVGLKNAAISSKDGKTVELSVFGKKNASKDTFTVKDCDGKVLTVSAVSATDTNATLTVSDGDVSKRPYTVALGEQSVSANIKSELIDDLKLKYDGDDLGLTLDGNKATFKLWAPTASSVEILLYSSADTIGTFKPATVAAKAIGGTDEPELEGTPAGTAEMKMDQTTGVWSAAIGNAESYMFYKYKISVNEKTYFVCDINAKICAADSVAAQIATIDDADAAPAGWESSYTNPWKGKSYADAVIYEMHIRDWSRAVVTDSTGKFLDIANSEKIMAHLNDLGVTHVQILPMFDYAQVNADKGYNWGYNPYHYNVPEGRYVTDGYTDGRQAVKEMREMIQKFHENGIAVIMDVVYNHTNGTASGSLYDSTVPGYFYRQKSDGSYSNGSGCGNEVATERTMVKKYVIDSLKHWMNDYHINGFRFDLMGCLSAGTMKDIYDTLYNIDPNVMVYGEPWTGGDSAVENSTNGAVAGSSGSGAGAFDDDFRDAIKGAEFGGFNVGQVQNANSDSGIIAGLVGDSGKNSRNTTGIPGLALHYVECHDNFTLYDKLVYSLDPAKTQAADKDGEIATAWPSSVSDEQIELIKKQDKLAAAYVLLSQGTPFINGGQEFLRTKKGNPDSYAADTKGGVFWKNIDEVNTVDLKMKEKYSDVYNTYKGLIALRKSSPAFTDGAGSTAETLAKGVTLYRAKSGSEEFDVYFNAGDSDFTIPGAQADGLLGIGVNSVAVSFGAKGKLVKIDETTGKVRTADTETTVSSVPAKSFVILKK